MKIIDLIKSKIFPQKDHISFLYETWLSRETRVRIIADVNGWEEIDHQKNIYMLSFKKGDCRINVYYSKGTVSTSLNHPTKGKTQLFRRNQSFRQMDKLFRNPRRHTGVGYYTK